MCGIVRGGKEKQQWDLLEDNYKEESGLFLEANEYQALHNISAPEETKFV